MSCIFCSERSINCWISFVKNGIIILNYTCTRFQNKEVSPETHQRTFGFVSDVTFLGNIVSEFIFSGFSWTSFPFRFFSFRSLSRKLQIVSEWLNSWRSKSLIVMEFMERTKHGQFKMIWLTESRRSEIHCIWFILY